VVYTRYTRVYHSRLSGLFKHQFRTAQSWNSMASAEPPYTGGLGAEPPVTSVGSRVQSPQWAGQGSKAPLKLNVFFVFACPKKAANLPYYWYLQKSVNHTVFNGVPPTNSHFVTSTISTYSCPWIQTSLTCAPARFVVFHLLHMQLYTVSEKYTPWLFTVSCCNLCYSVNKFTEYS